MGVRVCIGGAIAQHPIGAAGYVWSFLQYVLGFRQLGCEVLYVEELGADKCVDDEWRQVPFRESANVRNFDALVARFGLDECTALIAPGGDYIGRSQRQVDEWAGSADLFVNLSGRCHMRNALRAARRRLYLDLDPGFTQVWQAQYGVDMNLAGHDTHATVGLNFGQPDCPFPTLGLTWHPTVPPVVLSEWQASDSSGAAYTTVADWRGYSPIEWDGVWYGQKSEEFLKIISLPERVSVPIELCLAIHPDEPDRQALINHGWRLSDPRLHAGDTDRYREYVRGSRGEFSVVKHGYAAGRTGWVSDRSVCYLAAGRPVIVQDTGVAPHLAVGAGLLVFDDLDAAARAVREVESAYADHAAAARALATDVFSSERVLTRLLDVAGV